MAITDYDPSAALNTTLGSIYVGPNMEREDVNDALQQLMADLAPYANGLVAVKNVKDYGATGDGTTDDTTSFTTALAAIIAAGGGTLYVPVGTYIVSNLGGFQGAGVRIVGASKYNTIIKVKAGTTGAIFYNTGSASGTSAYCGVENLYIDLNGQNVTGIDLASVNNSTINNVYGEGGTSLGTATGRLVRCAAPIAQGAYNNLITNCGAVYMDRAFVAEDEANENMFLHCEAIVCNIGFDVEANVDTASLFGGRAEGCNIGLRTGGRETVVYGTRFEANNTGDVSFVTGAERCSFFGCYTATSAVQFHQESNCTGLYSRGGTFPQRDTEPNTSNTLIAAARRTFAAAGSAAALQANPTLAAPSWTSTGAAYFYDPAFLKNTATIEFGNNANTNSILAMNADASDRINIPGFDRASGTYKTIFIGENVSIQSGGFYWAGVKILGSQGAAVADASGGATVDTEARTAINTLLARLRTHGLIAT